MLLRLLCQHCKHCRVEYTALVFVQAFLGSADIWGYVKAAYRGSRKWLHFLCRPSGTLVSYEGWSQQPRPIITLENWLQCVEQAFRDSYEL